MIYQKRPPSSFGVPKLKEGRAAYLARVEKRRKKALGIIKDRQPLEWAWEFEGKSGKVLAYTRSEAKSRVKEILGAHRFPKEAALEAV